jgi:hypothetical protein
MAAIKFFLEGKMFKMVVSLLMTVCVFTTNTENLALEEQRVMSGDFNHDEFRGFINKLLKSYPKEDVSEILYFGVMSI